MKKTLIIILALLFTIASNAQEQHKEYYENGNLKEIGQYDDYNPELKTGLWKFYNKNGTIKEEGVYDENEKTLIWKIYDENGKLLKGHLYSKYGGFFQEELPLDKNGEIISLKWEDDFELAKIKSQKENKPILIFVNGPDWERLSLNYKNELFLKSKFIELSKNFIFFNACHFKRKNQENTTTNENTEKLINKYSNFKLSKFNFPSFIIINNDENISELSGYQRDVEKIYSFLNKALE